MVYQSIAGQLCLIIVRRKVLGHDLDMASGRRNRESPGPATLGSTLAAHLRLIVWCKACAHQAEPDVAELVERYGADLPLPEWRARLVCLACGSREVDFVVSGESGNFPSRAVTS